MRATVTHKEHRLFTSEPEAQLPAFWTRVLRRCGARYVGNPDHGRYSYRCTAWREIRRAILNPHLIVNHLDHVRLYDCWQRNVLKLMRESEIIILAPLDSRWVYWEMEQINSQGLESKTIVAFLPGSKTDRQSSIRAVASRLNGFSGIAPERVNGDLDLIWRTRLEKTAWPAFLAFRGTELRTMKP